MTCSCRCQGWGMSGMASQFPHDLETVHMDTGEGLVLMDTGEGLVLMGTGEGLVLMGTGGGLCVICTLGSGLMEG